VSTESKGKPSYRITEGGLWANAWKMALVIGAVGVVAAGVGYATDAQRFFFSYLFAFLTFLTIGVGALFFVLLLHFTGAGWGVTVRRTGEFFLAGIPVLVIAALPFLLNHNKLYDWADAAGHGEGHHAESLVGASTAHAQDHEGGRGGAHAAQGKGHGGGHGEASGGSHDMYSGLPMASHTKMEKQLHHELLAHKAPYLNVPFWLLRSIVYLIGFLLIARVYFRWSTKQDQTHDPKLTVKMQWWAPLCTVFTGLLLTFAAIDWIMALQAAWYSTIYGVFLFAASAVAIHALVILVALGLRKHGHLGGAVSVEHFHDLGKMLFGFICFWAYTGFSQWMLIWYAGLPEEATYFHWRWAAPGWKTVSMLLMLGHFVAPFFFLISRVPKRRLGMLGFGAAWMLFLHVVDMYWWVMPYAAGGRFAPHWMDLACLLAIGGIFFGVVFYVMRRYPLVPVGDPRLQRSLHFVQTQ
jgi:hypothetical protein